MSNPDQTKTDPLLIELADTLSELERASGANVVLTCERAEALIAARLGAPLPARGTAALEAHLAECQGCFDLARDAAGAAISDALLDLGGVAEEDLPELQPVSKDLYVRGHEVGRGGMGRIVRARDRRLGRAVAIKELLDERLADRFEREARLTARLQHPGIVGVLEAGRWEDGAPFYAMKYVAGRPLSEALAEEKTLAGRLRYLPNLIAAVDAVAYAHSERVIHRDLKPHNILIGPFGETVVVDWGLAKDLTQAVSDVPLAPYRDGGEGLTRAGAGTPRYMPPEQARGDDPDERADVYALGATLFHLLAGKSPDEPISMAAPDAPAELIAIVVKAMDPELSGRYADAAELAEELKRFQTGQLVEAHRYSLGDLARRFLRRHRLPVAIAGAALTLLAVGGGVGVSRILSARAEAIAERDRSVHAEGGLLVELARQELLADKVDSAREKLDRALASGETGPLARFLRAQVDRQTWPVVSDWALAAPSLESSTLTSDLRVVGADGMDVVAFGADLRVARARDTFGPRLSPDGRLVITTRRLESLSGEAFPHTLRRTSDFGAVFEIGDEATSVTFSGSGQHVVGWGKSSTSLSVFDLTGKRLARVPVASGVVADADVTVAGDQLVWVDRDARVHVWDLEAGRELLAFGTNIIHGDAFMVSLSPTGHRLAVANGFEVSLWDLDSGTWLASHPAGVHLRARRDLPWSADGRSFLLRGQERGTALVANADGGDATPLAELAGELVFGFTTDGRVAGIAAGHTTLWARSGRRLAVLDYPFTPTAATLDAAGTRLAVIGKQRTVIYQVPAAEQGSSLLDEPAVASAFAENGDLALVDRAGVVHFFDAGGKPRGVSRPSRPWPVEKQPKVAAIWDGRGRFYVMSLEGGLGVIETARRGRADFAGLAGWTGRTMFPTTRGMVVFGRDPEGAHRFELWHHDGGRRGLMPPGLDIDRVHYVSRDGVFAYAETRDWTVWRLDLQRGRALPLFQRHPLPMAKALESVSVSADGRLLVASTDATVQVWDGLAPRLLESHAADGASEGFSAGGMTYRTFGHVWLEGALWTLGPDGSAARTPTPDGGVLFRPDRVLSATASPGTVSLFAGAAPVARIRFETEVPLDLLGWSPDGQKLLVTTDQDTRLLDLSSK